VSPLRRLLALVRPVRWWLVLAILAAAGALVANIALMTAAPYLLSKAPLVTGFAALSVAVTAVRAFAIARASLRYVERTVTHSTALRILTELRTNVFRAIEPLAPGDLPDERSGDLLARIDADVDSLDVFFVRGLAPVIAACIGALAACAILGTLDPVLAFALGVFLVAVGAGVPLAARAASSTPAARLVEARGRLHADLAEQIDGMADLIAFGADVGALARDAAVATEIRDAQRRRARVLGAASGSAALLTGLAGIACLWLAIPQVRSGAIAGTFFAVVPLVAFAAFEGVAPLGDAARQIEISRAAAARTFALMDREPRIADPPTPIDAPADTSIAFRDVTFRYTPDAPPALDRLSFELPTGGRVGLVGASGAGKTTIVGLLLRFWDPVGGSIVVGDHDLRDYRLEDLRALFGVVPQHPYLFNGTFRDNLLLADGSADDEAIEDACDRATLGRFVASLPQGLDTPVGENGLKLSGGERQRVAVARLFLREAPIAILDEATANLDGPTERALLRELNAFAQDRTLLVVTHRRAPLDLADDVVRLDRQRA
jgi:ATP-binding cassette, subfamily C, bacterial CydC